MQGIFEVHRRFGVGISCVGSGFLDMEVRVEEGRGGRYSLFACQRLWVISVV